MEHFAPYIIERPPLYITPVIPYCVESAALTLKAIKEVEPDCIVTDLPSPLRDELIRAAGRLPDPTVIKFDHSYMMCEATDPAFEALRSGLEHGLDLHLINPSTLWRQISPLPDPYAIYRIGAAEFWHAFEKRRFSPPLPRQYLQEMARRLKELTLRYDRILYASHFGWYQEIMQLMEQDHFPHLEEKPVREVILGALTEEAAREVPSEPGWMVERYEIWRQEALQHPNLSLPDRQRWIYHLYKQAAKVWEETMSTPFPTSQMTPLMKFVRNWSLQTDHLLPDLYKIITAAKGCVEDSYALAVWKLATDYPHLRNVDNLPTWNLTPEEVWGDKKTMRFQLKERSKKSQIFSRKDKSRSSFRFTPPNPFAICSYQPEDKSVENFAEFLKKKGTQILTEEGARIIPFSGSLEDGIDVRETIRHFAEKKLYVKTRGKPPGAVGSIVVIFNEDRPQEETEAFQEKYPWKTSWLGEHEQESDMAFYATSMLDQVIGPGISRCEYGGFMMSYPPRRLYDIWIDPDYASLDHKHEKLLAAAIDYSKEPLILYSAEKPPSGRLKTYAARFGKKIVYFPLKEISPVTRRKIRFFHVLDGHDRRGIADEYIL